MKYLFTFMLLTISYLAQAQQLTDEMKRSFKLDDPNTLLSEVKGNNHKVDDCFEVEGISYTLLSLSIKTGRPNIFKTLLSNKVDLNKICSDKSPLMFAAKYGKLALAKELLTAGAKLDVTNAENQTALDYAIKYQHQEIVSYLTSLKAK